jgi:hypothetical protein
MKATLVALSIAVAPLSMPMASAPSYDDLPDASVPVGCSDPETLWDLLGAEEHHDRLLLAKLMHSRCRSLAGVRYMLEQQRNGVSRLRVFSSINNWSTSCVVYTLDEMVEPDQELSIPEPPRVPTGFAPRYILPPIV